MGIKTTWKNIKENVKSSAKESLVTHYEVSSIQTMVLLRVLRTIRQKEAS